MRTLKLKLYPSDNDNYLNDYINIAGIVWNVALGLIKEHYEEHKTHLEKYTLQKMLVALKKDENKEYAFFKLINSQVIQEVTDRLYRSYNLFFSNLKKKIKTSPPKFKKVKKYKSITFKQCGFKVMDDNKIKIGECVYRYHDSYDGLLNSVNIKTLTVKRNVLGEFFIYATVEASTMVYSRASDNCVGIDFGLKHFLTTSDGVKIDSPLFYKKALEELRIASLNLSRKAKGSKGRERAIKNLFRRHQDVVNKRTDFFWKLSHELCKNNSLIVLEDLSLKGMTKLWGRKVNDLAFNSFCEILEQCAKKYGTKIIFVNRFFASSKTCSKCGNVKEELTLEERFYHCKSCGHTMDRDINAAKNILQEGLRILDNRAIS